MTFRDKSFLKTYGTTYTELRQKAEATDSRWEIKELIHNDFYQTRSGGIVCLWECHELSRSYFIGDNLKEYTMNGFIDPLEKEKSSDDIVLFVLTPEIRVFHQLALTDERYLFTDDLKYANWELTEKWNRLRFNSWFRGEIGAKRFIERMSR